MDQQTFENQFAAIKDKCTDVAWTTDRRVFITCEAEECFVINKYLFETCGFRFVIATGIDTDHWFEILYHFDKDLRLTHFRLTVSGGASVPSISSVYFAAFLVENEIQDLFGIRFKGLAVDYERTLYLAGKTVWLSHIKPPYGHIVPRESRFASRHAVEEVPDPPDVVVFGHIHTPVIEHYKGVLIVNPGSATWPEYLPTLGTVALLTIGSGGVEARIVQLERPGVGNGASRS